MIHLYFFYLYLFVFQGAMKTLEINPDAPFMVYMCAHIYIYIYIIQYIYIYIYQPDMTIKPKVKYFTTSSATGSKYVSKSNPLGQG